MYEAAVREAATIESLIAVSDLDHLRASGRISAASRMLGSALSIKPVRTPSTVRSRCANGTGRSQGAGQDGRFRMEISGARPVAIGVQHCNAPEAADELMSELFRRIPTS